jgi:hypothetical protein
MSGMAVTHSLRLLNPALSCGKGFTAWEDFGVWWVVRNNIDKVIETDELVMQNFLNVTTCVAHYVIEEV